MVKIFVGNLNPKSKALDLQRKFEAFGPVTECDIVNNYGFVHMERESDAEAAISALQGSLLDGVKINIERSHGKRGSGGGGGGGPGPMRRHPDGRFRDMPPERPRGPPPRFMGPNPIPPPPPRMGRYGPPAWDDGYGRPYPSAARGPPGGYDRPMNGSGGRYPPERDHRLPRGPGREPLPPPPAREQLPHPPRDSRPPPGPGYRGGPDPPHSRDYPPKASRSRYDGPIDRPMDNFSSRYDGYGDGYGDYDRYRDAGPPQRSSDYYDNYGSYSSGGNYDDYRDGAYGSSYDYDYADYGVDNRSPAPPRYSYGRP